MSALMTNLRDTQRGLLVVAELTSSEDVAAALSISKALGWPVVADALSGKSHQTFPAVMVALLSLADTSI